MEIKNRYTGEVATQADGYHDMFMSADLTDADFADRDMSFAVFDSALCNRTNFTAAILVRTTFTNTDLTNTNFTDACLGGASLNRANCENTNFTNADVTGASFRHATFTNTNLRQANLATIRTDFFEVLSACPNEVDGLEQAIRDGQIDGSTYSSYGKCCCLVGTIAGIRQTPYDCVLGLVPDSARPAERWFLAMTPGMRVTHQIVAITLEWINEWRKENDDA